MPLTREQSIELGYVIEERRSALLDELREDVKRVRGEPREEMKGPGPDAGDESVADLIEGLDQAEVARELEELREIEAARKRFSEGNYGICLDCGGDIDYRRLRAYPAAIRCIDCQRRYEKTHSSAGGSTL
jgi:RNA polymerase-binding transcription factor DksA